MTVHEGAVGRGSALEPAPGRGFALALRAYPASWHHDGRSAELLGLVLDAAESRRRNASAARLATLLDVVNLLAHGLLARSSSLLTWLNPILRQRVALISMFSATAASSALLLRAELPLAATPEYSVVLNKFGPFLTPAALIYIGWLLAFALTCLGLPRITRVVVAINFLGTVAIPVVSPLIPVQRPPLTLLSCMAILSAGALLAPAGKSTLGRRVTLGLAMAAALAVLCYRLRWLLQGQGQDSRWYFYWFHGGLGLSGPTHSIPILLATAIALAAVGVRRDATWLAAMLIVAVPWLIAALDSWRGELLVGYALPLALLPMMRLAVAIAPGTPHRPRRQFDEAPTGTAT